MNFKLMAIYVVGIIYSIYYIVCGIEIRKHKVYTGWLANNQFGYSGALFLLFLINMTFPTNSNYIDINGFFIGMIPLVIFIFYILYKGLYHKKINIYNVNKDILKNTLGQILDKYNIEYEDNEDTLNSINLKAHIVLIGNCITIRNYKSLPNYGIIIDDLIKSLEKIDKSGKKNHGNLFLIVGCISLLFFVTLYLALL